MTIVDPIAMRIALQQGCVELAEHLQSTTGRGCVVVVVDFEMKMFRTGVKKMAFSATDRQNAIALVKAWLERVEAE